MKALLRKLNIFFGKLPDALRNHRLLVWGAFILATLIIGSGVVRLKVDMTMDSFFRENDPVKMTYDRFKESFGSDDGVYIVYEARDGDIFSQASLKAVKGIQQELLRSAGNLSKGESTPLGHIADVKTIVNVSYLEVKADTLNSRDFVETFPATAAKREKLRQQALEHKDYPLAYLSRDSRFGGIFIRTDFGTTPEGSDAAKTTGEVLFEEEERDLSKEAGNTPKGIRFKTTTLPEYTKFTRALEKVIQKPEYTQALRLYPVGNPILMGFMNDVINVELEALLSGAMLIMMVVLFILFRSFSAVIWPIGIVTFSSLLTLGLMGWLGVTMSMMLSILILLILVVGIADSVHILSGYLYFRRNRLEHAAALREVFKKSGLACLLTSVTTAAGMLALIFVPVIPIRNFGLAAAIGVLLAFLLTVSLLPLMLDLWGPVSRKRAEKLAGTRQRDSLIQMFLQKFEPLSYRYPLSMVLLFLIVGCVAAYGISKVKVDSNIVQVIKKGVPLREAFVLVDRVMGGTQNMEIFLDFGVQDALKDPRVLNAMEKMQRILETEHKAFVVKTESLVNVVKNSYRALNEDREEMYKIPQTRPMLAQTLLLFDSADSDERQLLVPDDYSQGRISVRLLNFGSMEYVEFFQDVRNRMERIFSPLEKTYPKMEVSLTGNLALLMQIADYISYSQIQSFALVLGVVTLLLLVLFGSIKAGLIAIVPNVFPVLVTFGVMGLFGIPLDVDTLIIAPIVIGIAVDDTIHFFTHYRAVFLESGQIIKSIKETLKEVGQAITFTSLILILGFFVLVVSIHQGMANFGFLIGVAFIAAWLADLLLLPSLFVLFNIQFEE